MAVALKKRRQSGEAVRSQLRSATERLRERVNALTFAPPVTHVYNPLDYAWQLHTEFIGRVSPQADVLFLGMNPGPWGMAQTGVPFGEVEAVRDWMKIKGEVGPVTNQHPKRPIEGFACSRSEVSGRRLWGLMRDRFEAPESFFKKHFVLNYCPLVFMEASGRNRTPDKLPVQERDALQDCCDEHLADVLQVLPWRFLVGVGAFAETCLKRVDQSDSGDRIICRILHPSPASPAANHDWSGTATKQLVDAGVWETL